MIVVVDWKVFISHGLNTDQTQIKRCVETFPKPTACGRKQRGGLF